MDGHAMVHSRDAALPRSAVDTKEMLAPGQHECYVMLREARPRELPRESVPQLGGSCPAYSDKADVCALGAAGRLRRELWERAALWSGLAWSVRQVCQVGETQGRALTQVSASPTRLLT